MNKRKRERRGKSKEGKEEEKRRLKDEGRQKGKRKGESKTKIGRKEREKRQSTYLTMFQTNSAGAVEGKRVKRKGRKRDRMKEGAAKAREK